MLRIVQCSTSQLLLLQGGVHGRKSNIMPICRQNITNKTRMMRRIHSGCEESPSSCWADSGAAFSGNGIELTSGAPGGTREAGSLGLAEESIPLDSTSSGL